LIANIAAAGQQLIRRCTVLSDRERKTLREVERRLLIEDPEFARSFAARAQRLPGPAGPLGIKIFLIAGLLVSAFVLVAGSLGGAVAFATATGLIWLTWRWAGEADPNGPTGESGGQR
jgi:hypothetical protein